MEYLIVAGVVGWLCRGCVEAYRRRKELKPSEIPGVIILGGGGAGPPKPK